MAVQATSGDTQGYQICTGPTSTISITPVMATSPALGTGGGTEKTRKKEGTRLMRNKKAVQLYRQNQNTYVQCFENRTARLERENRTIMEELKALKDLYI